MAGKGKGNPIRPWNDDNPIIDMTPPPKPSRDVLELCEAAATMLKAAGFEFYCSSRKSEACYYRWPGQVSLLRVAAHSKDQQDGEGLNHVAAKITFNGTIHDRAGMMRISDDKVEQVVAMGIGRYFMKRRP